MSFSQTPDSKTEINMKPAVFFSIIVVGVIINSMLLFNLIKIYQRNYEKMAECYRKRELK